MAHFPLLLRILFSGCHERVDESPQKLIRRNAPYDRTCSKVSTRSVYLYARESSPKKLQQDGHTHTNTLFKITFLDVLLIVLYIPNPVLSKTRFLCTMPLLPWDMEVKRTNPFAAARPSRPRNRAD